MSDFTNYSDAVSHRVDVLTLDTVSDSLMLEEKFLEKLVEPEEGLYIPGGLTPVFKKKGKYYRAKDLAFSKDDAKNSTIAGVKPIADLNTMIKQKDYDDIYDENMTLIIDKHKLSRLAKFLSDKPSIPIIPIRMAIGAVAKKITQFSRNSVPTPTFCDLCKLVKPEFHHEFDQDDDMIAFPYMMDKVTTFIGDDVWNVYSVDIKGTTVVITKGLDWRILEWYRMKFEKENKDQE